MSRLTPLIVLLPLGACRDAPVAPVVDEGIRLGAQASPVRSVVDTVIDNGCTGGEIALVGTVHVVSHQIQSTQGGMHIQFYLDQALDGTDLTSGTVYVHRSQSNFTAMFQAMPWEQTSVNSLVFVSRGSTENLVVKRLQHITVDASGALKAWHDEFRYVCQ